MTTVLTAGCFDLFHFGHLELFKYCHQLGRVIVGVNDDRRIAQIKSGRPIIPLAERLAIIESCRFVDEVIVFNEDTPAELIDRLKPDIYVKGKGYNSSNLPEFANLQKYGGELRIFDPGLNISTSQIVNRVVRSVLQERNA